MQANPLVSVIMIFLDAERFMCEAVESVLSQTYDNWELVFVDDGSSDGSTEIALGYVRQHPYKMRYFEHEGHRNLGMSASRNYGIQKSQGKYIAFLDADDIYLPEKLEKQVAILETQRAAAMVYGPSLHWYSWTGRTEDEQRDFVRKLGVTPNCLVQPPEMALRFLRHEAWTPGTCAVLIRRKSLEEIGWFEDHFRGMLEDQVFFYKLCLKYPVFIEGNTWDHYRQHSDSHYYVSLNKRSYDPRRPNPAHRKFYLWLESYLSEQKVEHTELWAALNEKLFPYRHPVLYKIFTAARRFIASQSVWRYSGH